eukprot:COSAG01_NODE_57502_length_312_cov_0.370892_1_plen_33_part_10
MIRTEAVTETPLATFLVIPSSVSQLILELGEVV